MLVRIERPIRALRMKIAAQPREQAKRVYNDYHFRIYQGDRGWKV